MDMLRYSCYEGPMDVVMLQNCAFLANGSSSAKLIHRSLTYVLISIIAANVDVVIVKPRRDASSLWQFGTCQQCRKLRPSLSLSRSLNFAFSSVHFFGSLTICSAKLLPHDWQQRLVPRLERDVCFQVLLFVDCARGQPHIRKKESSHMIISINSLNESRHISLKTAVWIPHLAQGPPLELERDLLNLLCLHVLFGVIV